MMTDRSYNTSPKGRLSSEAADAVLSAAAREAKRLVPSHAIAWASARLALEAAARALDTGRRDQKLIPAIRALHDMTDPDDPATPEEKADYAARLRRILRDLAKASIEVAKDLDDMGAHGAPRGLDWFDVVLALKEVADDEHPDTHAKDLSQFHVEAHGPHPTPRAEPFITLYSHPGKD